jgi:hypothetical protein
MSGKTWFILAVAAGAGVLWYLGTRPQQPGADAGVLNTGGPPVNGDSKLANAINTGVAAYNAGMDAYTKGKELLKSQTGGTK